VNWYIVCGGTPLSRVLFPVFRRYVSFVDGVVVPCVPIVCACARVCSTAVYLIFNRDEKNWLNNEIFEGTDLTGCIIQRNILRESPYIPHTGAM
jgi:hypothetical protein